MKLLFLPAIKVLNKLSFPQKILLAVLFLFLPIAIGFFMYGNKILDETKNNQKLKEALAYTNTLKEFYMHIPIHRGMMHAKYKSDNSFDEKIIEIRKHLEEDIKNVDSALLTYDNFSHHRNKWKTTKEIWKKIVDEAGKRTALDCFEYHSDVIEKTLSLMKSIGKEFNPALTSHDSVDYYLMKILTEDIIKLAEQEAGLRGIGVGVLASKKISDFEKHEMILFYSMADIWLNTLRDDMQIVLSAKDIKNSEVEKRFNEIANRIENYLLLVDKNILEAKSIKGNTADFFEESTDIIEDSFRLYDDISALLQKRIEKHEIDFRNKVFLIIALVAVVLLILFYANTAFYMAFMDSLKKIIDGAQKMGDGNYDTRIELQTKDEMATISEAFNKMAKATQHYNAFLKSYKNAIDKSAIVSIMIPDGRIIYANDKFYSITGYSKEEVIGNTHKIMTHADFNEEAFQDTTKIMQLKKTWNGIVKNITKNGTIFYTDTTIVPIIDESNQITEYIAIRKDITDLLKSKQKLIDQLYSDNLTGLPNRLKLIEDLKNKESKELFMVLLNIDRFKEINDYYGYDIGDKLLISLKDRLLNFSKKIQASVYRVHADEFAILIKKDDLKKTIDENVEELHKEIDDKPYKIKDDEFNLNITIGASAVDKIATKEENDLLVNADLALRSAKKEKKDFLVFDSTISLKKESEENLKWTQKLKDAIKNDRIISYFQPIYDNKAKDIKRKRYECLMRLVENDGSIVSPFAFLNIAKKAKLYTKLTKIMVEKAFETFKDKDNFSFSINISAEDILDKNTASFIKEKVKESPVAKNAIFEIVESEGIENFSEVKDFINYVKSFGCKIAIDDFGTGYSNFEYLMKLNIDIIKIDGSLIKNITSDKDAQTIVKTIIDFAKELNIEIVAEYVHSKEVQKEIENLDIEYSQGFYLSEPKSSIS